MVPQEGPVGSITETSSVDSESCWGEMEDLIGEEKVEWGCCHAPAVQSSIEVVEALERDLLAESNKHNVDQDASGAKHVTISAESPTRHGSQPIRRVGPGRDL